MRIPIIIALRRSGFIILISLLFASIAFGQDPEVKGQVYDSISHMALSGAHIIIKNTRNGCKAEQNGFFKIKVDHLPIKLIISHIGYKTQEIEILNADIQLNIAMSVKLVELSSVNVNSNSIVNLVENRKLFVIDYAFQNDSIIILSYKNRHQNEAQLLLMSSTGKELREKNLNEIDYLDTDVLRQNHLIGKKTARQIILRDTLLELGNEMPIEEFDKIQKTLIGYSAPYYYLRQNSMGNQVVRIYRYDENIDKLELIREIQDEAGLERLSDKGRLQSAIGYTESDARFEEMCFYAPKYIPLLKLKTKLYLFNFGSDILEIMDSAGNILNSIAINFHHSNTWEGDILVDEISEQMYAVFSNHGIYSIAKIELETGEIGRLIKVPNLAHIEKMKVHQNKLYFLYKGNIENKYKELYSMNL